ncbi:Putative lipase essential for disintegration of autophagic bodies inside the vacuole [Paenibacillus uliginis N3/975]|uniref:triacylglycerol lipase n=1 Tax=Paenibacillus uliginis N3/975 TaxID=1313296 RepID=A0A1X7HSI9_9BACL|nr:hypothetical protein [Paenibacillus uliginis]SMF91542.1 Putative lipase essential for disintegration of autophagic bodies inside the vacuole [Paenibacillus uliginis N3/975]
MGDNYISDKIYNKASQIAYNEVPPGKLTEDGLEGWSVVEPDGADLHRFSGFDAMVLRNDTTDQVIIAYRGTEAGGMNVAKVKDIYTDAVDVVGGRPKDLENSLDHPWKTLWNDGPVKLVSDKIQYENNQFHQAEELYDAVKKAYPNSDISLTGHSLGGGLAQYVAARQDLPAVTYSAPSTLNSLSDELVAKVENGDFDNQIINYVHPSDSVGAGGLEEYDRHIGSTYYLGSDFDTANAKYDQILNVPIPLHGTGLLGVVMPYYNLEIDTGKYYIGDLRRFYDSVLNGETNYHSPSQYKFDENGNLRGPLVDRLSGETLDGSPRGAAYAATMAALASLINFGGNSLKAMLASGLPGSGGAHGLIQLTPAELLEAAKQMRQSAEGFSSDSRSAVQFIENNIRTSESRSLTPIAENTSVSLHGIQQWYEAAMLEIADYIDRKAQDFILADES